MDLREKHSRALHVIRYPVVSRFAVFSVGLVFALVILLGLVLAPGWGCGGGKSAAYLAQSGSTQSLSGLHVVPFPDTPDASPQTDVMFMSLSPQDLGSVRVSGSLSAGHDGTIAALPGGAGMAFTPDAPFLPGEKVTVQADLTSNAAVESIGGTGHSIQFTFTIAEIATTTTASTTTTTTSGEQASPPPTWDFQSEPDLHPPVMSIVVADQDPDAGYIFLDAQQSPQAGPMIIDNEGRIVWFLGMPKNTYALDLKIQDYQGHPVLTWWQGAIDPSGHGLGEHRIVETSYQPVATVEAGFGYSADLHDFQMTPRGTAWITAYDPVKMDLTPIGGEADGGIYDGIIQEIDIATGRVLWEWHALGHVPIERSYSNKPNPGTIWDFFHINSIAETPEGDLIVSARNTWGIYRIDRGTGKILWQFGGIGGNFNAAGVQFEWQHDARLLATGQVTVFNDASYPEEESESRGMVFTLDSTLMTATLAAGYTHDPPLLAGSQGNMMLLPNGNFFLGWGDQPYFSEYTADGTVVFDGKFPGPIQSYRAYRFPWSAQPADTPKAVLKTNANGGQTVYASWNGATGVDMWELVGGETASSAQRLATAVWAGFETALPTETTPSYLAVRALDGTGSVLATTSVSR